MVQSNKQKRKEIKEIKVSVIIAVYNAEKYLRQCLESIVHQTLREIEIICVNDGSTDNSLAILNEYAKLDPRIRIIDKKNQGAGIARNTGMQIARGRYFSFLDSDDFFELSMLEQAYEAAESNQADIVIYGCDFYDNQNATFEKKDWTLKRKQLPAVNPFSVSDIGNKIFSFTVGWAWDKLFRRDFIVSNNISFYEKNVLEDAHFTCQACALAKRIYILDRVLAHYRTNTTGALTKRIDEYVGEVYNSLQSLKERLQAAGVYEKEEQAFINRAAAAYHNIFTRVSERVRKQYYDQLKNFFEKQNIFGHNRDYFFEKYVYEFIRKVYEMTYEEYCMDESFLKDNPGDIILSVVIPVYNTEEFLVHCLESVLNQSFRAIEIICVDDGSTDGSLAILQEYQKKDKRVLVLPRENQNAGAARNYGMKFIHGRYVHFLDSDDWIEKDIYQKAVRIMNSNSPDMCIFWHKNYDNETHEYKDIKSFALAQGEVENTSFTKKYEYFASTDVVPWNKIYNRDFIFSIHAKFDEIVCANDRTFYFYTIFYAKKIARASEFITVHRVNNTASLAGGGRKKHFDCHLFANSKIISYAEQFNDTIKEFIINVNMGDLFRWLPESDEETRNQNYTAVAEYCSRIFKKINVESFRKRRWYANAKIALLSRDLPVNQDIVPIVLIGQREKIPFLDVTLLSIIANLTTKYFYDIYVLIDGFNYESVKQLELHSGLNRRVKCVDIHSAVQKYGTSWQRSKYPAEILKLIIPELFCQYQKLICLSGDLIINSDLAKLYSVDVKECVVGAVAHLVSKAEHEKVLNVLKLRGDKYLNGAVLVYNNNLFLEKNIRDLGVSFLEKKGNRQFTAAEMLSTTLRANDLKVFFLDSGWNYQLHPNKFPESNLSEGSLRFFVNARSKKYILNYDFDRKPWLYPENPDSIYFWKYADKSFWFEIIKQISVIRRLELCVESGVLQREKLYGEENKLSGNKLKSKQKAKKKKSSGVRENVVRKPTIFSRFFRCLRTNGIKYTFIRIFKGHEAAVQYKNLKNNT